MSVDVREKHEALFHSDNSSARRSQTAATNHLSIRAISIQTISIDCIASIAYFANMSTTLTIRNLDEGVKQKLRLRAASHQRSMEAEAREILAAALSIREGFAPPRSPEEMRERLKAVSGIWKDRMEGKTTDEIMQELRGDE